MSSKKKKGLIIGIISLIIFLIIGVLGTLYFVQANKPINKMKSLLLQFGSEINSEIPSEKTGFEDKLINILNEKSSVFGKVNLKINEFDTEEYESLGQGSSSSITTAMDETRKELEKYEINFNYESDKENEEQLMEFGYTDKEENKTYNSYRIFSSKDKYGIGMPELLNTNLVANKDEMIENDLESLVTFIDTLNTIEYSKKEFSKEELIKLNKAIKPVLDKYITEDKFKEEKGNSTISFVISEKECGEFLKEIFTVFRDNEEVKNIIINKLNTSSDIEKFKVVYEEQLDDLIDETRYFTSKDLLIIQVKYKGRKVENINIKTSDGQIVITHPEKGTIIADVINETDPMTLKMKVNGLNDYTFEMYIKEEDATVVLGLKSDNKILRDDNLKQIVTITLEMKSEEMKINGELVIDLEYKTITKTNIPDLNKAAKIFDENVQKQISNELERLVTDEPEALVKKAPGIGHILLMQFGTQSAFETNIDSLEGMDYMIDPDFSV